MGMVPDWAFALTLGVGVKPLHIMEKRPVLTAPDVWHVGALYSPYIEISTPTYIDLTYPLHMSICHIVGISRGFALMLRISNVIMRAGSAGIGMGMPTERVGPRVRVARARSHWLTCTETSKLPNCKIGTFAD